MKTFLSTFCCFLLASSSIRSQTFYAHLTNSGPATFNFAPGMGVYHKCSPFYLWTLQEAVTTGSIDAGSQLPLSGISGGCGDNRVGKPGWNFTDSFQWRDNANDTSHPVATFPSEIPPIHLYLDVQGVRNQAMPDDAGDLAWLEFWKKYPDFDLDKAAGGCDQGMPIWRVSEPYISLWLFDEPLGYQPALGPRISFELAFKQRESTNGFDPNTFGVGPRWNVSWLSYVTQISGTNIVNFSGGGRRAYITPNDYLTNTRLTGDTTNGFTLSNPDGSKDVYGLVVTNELGAFQKAFLTERWDAQSQKIVLQYSAYDSSDPVIRLQYVIDGDGRTNTVQYISSGSNTNLISTVIDPFGRSTSLSYDVSGQLTNIVDVVGITNSFGYDTNHCVTSLIRHMAQRCSH